MNRLAGRLLADFSKAFRHGTTGSSPRRSSPKIQFRALLPGGPSEWQGPGETADILRSWFGGAEQFEVIDAAVGEVAGRLQMTWRIRLRPAPFGIGDGWHLIEQHAFADAGDNIAALDLVCSGFRAERSTRNDQSRE
jgi:hypothetical protein